MRLQIYYAEDDITDKRLRENFCKTGLGRVIVGKGTIFDKFISNFRNFNVNVLENLSDAEIFGDSDCKLLIWHSSFVIFDSFLFQNSINFNGTYKFSVNGKTCGYLLSAGEKINLADSENFDYESEISLENCVSNIDDFDNFVHYLTNSYDNRFFNRIIQNNETVTKISSNKEKIVAEYNYYDFLDDAVKKYFLKPSNLKIESQYASYEMERIKMVDSSVFYVNNWFDNKTFEKFLSEIFNYIDLRDKKTISKEESREIFNKLYIDKVNCRLDQLKQYSDYSVIDGLIKEGTNFKSIDDIKNFYLSTLEKIISENDVVKDFIVLDHGDLCFSNIIFSPSKKEDALKFIDVRGAKSKREAYMDYYYDIVKLSHSICGKYDFFNKNQYEIVLNKQGLFELQINFNNTRFVEIFKRELKKKNIDYRLIRVLEASLFLSMTPLHIDNIHKTFGFILNAIGILEEITKNV